MTGVSAGPPTIHLPAAGDLGSASTECPSVRLMVADVANGAVTHDCFSRISDWLRPGDLLIINVSATVPAALEGRSDEGPVRLHLSSPVAGSLWTVEPRRPAGVGSQPWFDFGGGRVHLSGGAEAHLLRRDNRSPRLWLADLGDLGEPLDYLQRHGEPIRYAHESRALPLGAYQTVYARDPGSAEMPSAGRPFSAQLITDLVASGVLVAPLLLHCGVASFEAGERPDAERYDVSETTARLVNQTRAAGGRVVAVGTTSARALETVTDASGLVHPGRGVTELLITPERGVRAIDGIISGWHEAGASHIDLLEAVAGRDVVERCYAEAKANGYQWHEFGDALLVLAQTPPRGVPSPHA